MEEVGRGVVSRDLAPPPAIDRRGRLLTDMQLARDHRPEVSDYATGRLLSVLDPHTAAGRADGPGVADLAAGLCIERRALHEDLDDITLNRRVRGFPFLAHGHDGALGGELVVSRELGLREVLGIDPLSRDGTPRSLALSGHRELKSFL